MSGMIELTAYSGKFLGPIAKVLGWIMSGIYDIVLKISGGAFTGHRATTGSSRTNSIKNLNMIANPLISFRIISKNSLQR